ARIPPPARCVNWRTAGERQVTREAAVLIYVGSEIDTRRLVIHVACRRSQLGGDKVSPVALVLVVRQAVRQRGCIHVRSAIDHKGGRCRGRGSRHFDRVSASDGESVKIERVNIGETAPGSQSGAYCRAKKRLVRRIDEAEGGASLRSRR